MSRLFHILWYSIFIFCLLAVTGCAFYRPKPLEAVPFRVRAQTKTQGNLRVSVVVLSAEESKQIFDVPLARQGIQPVWIEVENKGDETYFILPRSVDPDYFAPAEVSYRNHYSFIRLAWSANRRMDELFQEYSIRPFFPPGTVSSGFIFTNIDEGIKGVNIDFTADNDFLNFTFIVDVPGLRADVHRVDFESIYTPDEIIDYKNEEDLRAALEQLPCCTTNKKGTKNGDPLNLVIIADEDAFTLNFVRSGWHMTEVLAAGSGWRTVKAALFGGEYRYSPISALYVYDRPQDVGLQKARDTIHQRNHLRLWLAPMRFQGKDVWVGQISRDIGSRFTTKTWWLSTHKIDPDVDESRWALMQDLYYARGLEKFGFVKGAGLAPPSAPRENLTGDPYFTDGLRAVMMLSMEEIRDEDIELFDWEELNPDWDELERRWQKQDGEVAATN